MKERYCLCGVAVTVRANRGRIVATMDGTPEDVATLNHRLATGTATAFAEQVTMAVIRAGEAIIKARAAK